jgi:hypothetical protein
LDAWTAICPQIGSDLASEKNVQIKINGKIIRSYDDLLHVNLRWHKTKEEDTNCFTW